MTDYYERNKEKCKADARAYYYKHKQKMNEYSVRMRTDENVKHGKNVSYALECNPPAQCFECKLKDCHRPIYKKQTAEEREYMKASGIDDYFKNKKKKENEEYQEEEWND